MDSAHAPNQRWLVRITFRVFSFNLHVTTSASALSACNSAARLMSGDTGARNNSRGGEQPSVVSTREQCERPQRTCRQQGQTCNNGFAAQRRCAAEMPFLLQARCGA